VSVIGVERRGIVGWITLNRPEALNALSGELLLALEDAVTELGGDPAVRLVAVTGAGDRAFSAGADLKERRGMTEAQTRERIDLINRCFTALAHLPKLTVAAVNGVAFGGGFELALACDLRVAAAGAEVGLTEVRLGIIPGAGGTQRLARVVGVARAKEMILFGGRVDAQRALAMGLVSEVAADLEGAVTKRVEELAACAPIAVAKAKEAIDRGFDLPIAEALALERACYEATLGTEDRQEGLRAFAEKRKPEFKGR